ncbi:MAG: helix-turn-helix transcriptional regulator [Treponema sp.]|nr:helix-turn-helix transcriptional regulator [Treponema sp.]
MANKKEIDEYQIQLLISNNMKRLRSLQNISQLNLAVETGLSHNFIHDIENCKKGFSAKTLAKLSIALKAEPYQFFLPQDMPNNEAMVYINDFNESLWKIVYELTQRYTNKDKKNQ